MGITGASPANSRAAYARISNVGLPVSLMGGREGSERLTLVASPQHHRSRNCVHWAGWLAGGASARHLLGGKDK
jgi:hypothetical protein